MHPALKEILARLASSRANLRETVNRVPAELRDRVPVTPDTGPEAGIQLSWKCDGKGPHEDRAGR